LPGVGGGPLASLAVEVEFRPKRPPGDAALLRSDALVVRSA